MGDLGGCCVPSSRRPGHGSSHKCNYCNDFCQEACDLISSLVLSLADPTRRESNSEIGNIPYACSTCTEYFCTESDLRHHVSRQHEGSVDFVPLDTLKEVIDLIFEENVTKAQRKQPVVTSSRPGKKTNLWLARHVLDTRAEYERVNKPPESRRNLDPPRRRQNLGLRVTSHLRGIPVPRGNPVSRGIPEPRGNLKSSGASMLGRTPTRSSTSGQSKPLEHGGIPEVLPPLPGTDSRSNHLQGKETEREDGDTGPSEESDPFLNSDNISYTCEICGTGIRTSDRIVETEDGNRKCRTCSYAAPTDVTLQTESEPVSGKSAMEDKDLRNNVSLNSERSFEGEQNKHLDLHLVELKKQSLTSRGSDDQLQMQVSQKGDKQLKQFKGRSTDLHCRLCRQSFKSVRGLAIHMAWERRGMRNAKLHERVKLRESEKCIPRIQVHEVITKIPNPIGVVGGDSSKNVGGALPLPYQPEVEGVDVHGGVKSHKCTVCERSFDTARGLKRHWHWRHAKEDAHENENKDGLVPCTQCKKVFKSEDEMKAHWRLHKTTYSSESPLRHHITFKLNSKRDIVFTCNICLRSFKSKKTLQLHRVAAKHQPGTSKRSLHGGQPYRCNMCEETFWIKDEFRRHHLTHGKKNYSCDECTQTFGTKEGLQDHLKEPHEVIKCSTCSLTFQTEKGLQRHIETFRCTACNKCFPRAQSLRDHLMEMYSEEGSKECPECGVHTSDLQTHMHRHLRAQRWAHVSANHTSDEGQEDGSSV